MTRVLGLITARGGSKGIKDKNIQPLMGKPLIAWTIEAAARSAQVDRVVVSTDDPKIADAALRFGAEVPFMRPTELAQDTSPHNEVISHAVNWLFEHQGYTPDYILLLQPTSPLRTTWDIDEAIHLCFNQEATAVVGICPADKHPYLLKKINGDGVLEDYFPPDPKIGYLRRQDFPPAYVLNGAIYIVKASIFKETQSLLPQGTIGYVMPNERSIDIDTPLDLYIANCLLKDKYGHQND